MDKKFIIIIIISVFTLFYLKKNVENMNKDTIDFSKKYDINREDSTPTTDTEKTKPLKKYLESLKKIDSFIQFYYNNESLGNAKEGLKINGSKLNVKNLKTDNIEKCHKLKKNNHVNNLIKDKDIIQVKTTYDKGLHNARKSNDGKVLLWGPGHWYQIHMEAKD